MKLHLILIILISSSIFAKDIDSLLDFETYWKTLFWQTVDSNNNIWLSQNVQKNDTNQFMHQIYGRFKCISFLYESFERNNTDTVNIMFSMDTAQVWKASLVYSNITNIKFKSELLQKINTDPIKSCKAHANPMIIPLIFRKK
jgi:hypothetical protein